MPERDTQGAIQDLGMARSYLDDWIRHKGIIGRDKYLTHATKYLQSATTKDPDAQIDGQPGYVPETVNTLAGEALFYEAQQCVALAEIGGPSAKMEFLKAKDLYNRALEYQPNNLQYRVRLADIHLNLYDKPGALEVASAAVSNNPSSIEARKFLDRIEAAPDLSPPGFFDKNPDILRSLIALGVYIVLLIIVATSLYTFNFVFAALAVGAMFWYRRYRANHELHLGAIEIVQERLRKEL